MLTDPALDAGRHEFYIRTLLGRIPSAENLPLNIKGDSLVLEKNAFIPPVREIYPIIIGSMSVGALSPPMWEGLAMGVAYLNEVENMPVVMGSGEGGMPLRLLKSKFLKYFPQASFIAPSASATVRPSIETLPMVGSIMSPWLEICC